MCLQNIPCGIFSLEMGRSQLVQRLLSQQSSVAGYKIKVNKLEQYDRIRLFEAKAEMRTWPIKINDEAGMTLRRLRTKATIWKKKHGIRFLVVDYLQLMGSDNNKINREAVISEISRGLKVLAKDLDIPIIALSQLSREVEKRTDKMPQLSDLRESGAIEQDADQIWFLMRPDYYKMDGSISVDGGNYDCADVCILDVAKFRAGETKQVPLKFHSMTMTFTDY
jgi:replicative DNA helicase